jgi:hypothetical protein
MHLGDGVSRRKGVSRKKLESQASTRVCRVSGAEDAPRNAPRRDSLPVLARADGSPLPSEPPHAKERRTGRSGRHALQRFQPPYLARAWPVHCSHSGPLAAGARAWAESPAAGASSEGPMPGVPARGAGQLRPDRDRRQRAPHGPPGGHRDNPPREGVEQSAFATERTPGPSPLGRTRSRAQDQADDPSGPVDNRPARASPQPLAADFHGPRLSVPCISNRGNRGTAERNDYGKRRPAADESKPRKAAAETAATAERPAAASPPHSADVRPLTLPGPAGARGTPFARLRRPTSGTRRGGLGPVDKSAAGSLGTIGRPYRGGLSSPGFTWRRRPLTTPRTGSESPASAYVRKDPRRSLRFTGVAGVAYAAAPGPCGGAGSESPASAYVRKDPPRPA